MKEQKLKEQFFKLTKKVLPLLTPAEASVLFHVFAETVASDQDSVRFSYDNLGKLTGMSTPSIQKAVRNLLKIGVIKTVGKTEERKARKYKYIDLTDEALDAMFSKKALAERQ